MAVYVRLAGTLTSTPITLSLAGNPGAYFENSNDVGQVGLCRCVIDSTTRRSATCTSPNHLCTFLASSETGYVTVDVNVPAAAGAGNGSATVEFLDPCPQGFVFKAKGGCNLPNLLFGGEDVFAQHGDPSTWPNLDDFGGADSGGVPLAPGASGSFSPYVAGMPSPSALKYTWPQGCEGYKYAADACGEPTGRCDTATITGHPLTCAAAQAGDPGACRLALATSFTDGPAAAPTPPAGWPLQRPTNILRVTTDRGDVYTRSSPGSITSQVTITVSKVATGDKITINGQTFAAVASGQNPPPNTIPFTVVVGDDNSTAQNLEGALANATTSNRALQNLTPSIVPSSNVVDIGVPSGTPFGVTDESTSFTVAPAVATGLNTDPPLTGDTGPALDGVSVGGSQKTCSFNQGEPRNEIQQPATWSSGQRLPVPIGLGDGLSEDDTHQDEYFTWWVYLPTDMPPPCSPHTQSGTLDCDNLWGNIVQFHQEFDDQDTESAACTSSPPLAIALNAWHVQSDPVLLDGHWHWTISARTAPTQDPNKALVWASPALIGSDLGIWHSFKLHVYWSDTAATSYSTETSTCVTATCADTSKDWCPADHTCAPVAGNPYTNPGNGVVELWIDGTRVYSAPQRTIWTYDADCPASGNPASGPLPMLMRTGLYRALRGPESLTLYFTGYGITGGPKGSGGVSLAAASAMVDGWTP